MHILLSPGTRLQDIENNVFTRVTNCFSAEERVILGVIINKYQDITRLSAETVRHESTYIILFLIRLNESISCDKNDDRYTSSPCVTRFLFC